MNKPKARFVEVRCPHCGFVQPIYRDADLMGNPIKVDEDSYLNDLMDENNELRTEIAELEAQSESWRERNGGNMAIAESLAKQVQEKDERIAELESLVRDMFEEFRYTPSACHCDAICDFEERMAALGIEVEE